MEKKKKNFNNATKPVRIRFSPEQISALKKEACELKISLAEYLRTKIASGTVKVRFVDVKYDKMLYEMNKIGVNLNQFVAKYHRDGRATDVENNVKELVQTIKDLMLNVKSKLAEEK